VGYKLAYMVAHYM